MFCFIHIEKAGGSTLHNWLKYYIPNYLSLKPWYIWTNERQHSFSNEELKYLKLFHPSLQGFGSHIVHHDLNYEQLFQSKYFLYFTFLREPTSRYLSHFQHQKYVMKNSYTLESFLEESRFNNFMCKKIINKENGIEAFNVLSKKFGFVGIIENFNESLLLLCQIMNRKGLKPFYEKRNEGNIGVKVKFTELSKNIQKRIIENNSQDIILYNKVINELYPMQQNNYNGILTDDLKKLESVLQDFKYNKIRKEAIKLFKGYNHYISEPIAHFFASY